MNVTKIFNAQRFVLLALSLFLLATPALAQDIELTEAQQSQLAQNLEITKDRLELTEEQAVAVEEIISNSMVERFLILEKYGIDPNDPSFRRPDRSTLKSMQEDMGRLDSDIKNQLGQHLSKDQMKTWKKLEKERKNRMRSQMMGRR